ncbi:MAG: hypothetical protein R3Y59_06680 [bacterium]
MSWVLYIIIGLIILFVLINALFKRGNHYWTREEDEHNEKYPED